MRTNFQSCYRVVDHPTRGSLRSERSRRRSRLSHSSNPLLSLPVQQKYLLLPIRRSISHFYGMPIDPGTPSQPEPVEGPVTKPLQLTPKRDAEDTWNGKSKRQETAKEIVERVAEAVTPRRTSPPLVRTIWMGDMTGKEARQAKSKRANLPRLRDTLEKLKMGVSYETKTLSAPDIKQYHLMLKRIMREELTQWQYREREEDHKEPVPSDPTSWTNQPRRSAMQRRIEYNTFRSDLLKHRDAHLAGVVRKHMYTENVEKLFLLTLHNMQAVTAQVIKKNPHYGLYNQSVDSLSSGQYAAHFDYLRIGIEPRAAFRNAGLKYSWDEMSNTDELQYLDQEMQSEWTKETMIGTRIDVPQDSRLTPFPRLPKFPIPQHAMAKLLEEIIAYNLSPQLHKILVKSGEMLTEAQSKAIFDIISYPGHKLLLTTPIMNLAIQFYVYKGNLGRARALYIYLENIGLQPDINTFYAFLRDAARHHNMIRFAYHFEAMISKGIKPNAHTWAAFLATVVDIDNKARIIGAMKFIGLTPEKTHAREVFDVIFRKEALRTGSESFLPGWLESKISQVAMTKKVLHHILTHLFMKDRDADAFRFLFKTTETSNIRPDGVMLHMIVGWLCTRKRMNRLVRTLREMENRWGLRASAQTLQKIHQGAFLCGAYNIGRVVWRHAAMTGRLTYEMKARVSRHLNGIGPKRGEYGKFCVGVEMADTPELLSNAVWALEAEEVNWPPQPTGETLDRAAVLDRNHQFNTRVRQFRDKLFKSDELSFIKWKPARTLVEDLEEALVEDKRRGWGFAQKAQGYIAWVKNQEGKQVLRVALDYEVKRIHRKVEMHELNDPEVLAQVDEDVVWRSIRHPVEVGETSKFKTGSLTPGNTEYSPQTSLDGTIDCENTTFIKFWGGMFEPLREVAQTEARTGSAADWDSGGWEAAAKNIANATRDATHTPAADWDLGSWEAVQGRSIESSASLNELTQKPRISLIENNKSGDIPKMEAHKLGGSVTDDGPKVRKIVRNSTAEAGEVDGDQMTFSPTVAKGTTLTRPQPWKNGKPDQTSEI